MADAPAPHTPEREKLPVVDYDFYFLGKSDPLQISVWPSLGDAGVESNDRFVFTFTRLKREDTVMKQNILTFSKVEGTRAPLTQEDFLRIVNAGRKKKDDGTS